MKQENKMMIVPYEEKYYEGVLKCLRRNFTTLNAMNEFELKKWFSPLISYEWSKKISKKNLPYKYGMVLLDGEVVVGYCGIIYSIQNSNGCDFICANASTWGIDSEYRFYVYDAMEILLKSAELVTDFSPSPIMEKINKELYKFEYYEQKAYKLTAKDKLINNVTMELCELTNQDTIPEDIFTKYKDNKKYGCICIKIRERQSSKESYCIFYDTKPMCNDKGWLHIVFVSDKECFSKHLGEIVFDLYEKFKKNVLCDGNFIDERIASFPDYEIVKRRRMIHKKNKELKVPGLLYSEMTLLKY